MAARRALLVVLASLSWLLACASLSAPAALAESCPNAASRQGPSSALPDCRAYEQVTPVNKGDAVDLFGGGEEFTQVRDGGFPTEDGNKFFLFNSLSSIGEQGTAGLSDYLFTRGPGGWSASGVLKPEGGAQSMDVRAFNPSLTDVGALDRLGSGQDLFAGNPSAFGAQNLAGPIQGPYATVTSLTGFAAFETVEIVGASADFRHVVVQGRDHGLAPGAASVDEGANVLYDWSGGEMRLLATAEDGSPISLCGAVLGRDTSPEGGTHEAVSQDGARVVFTAPDPEASGAGCWNQSSTPEENAPQVYMREEEPGGRFKTVEVSAPASGVLDPTGQHAAVFAGASADGARIFFLSTAQLTADDTTHAPELYEYDVERPEGERLRRVSSGDSGTAEGNVDFVGGVSSDGSTVYFTAFGALAPGASVQAEENEGHANLYRYDTQTGQTTFVAAIGSEDYPLIGGEYPNIWWQQVFPSGNSHGRPPKDEFALVQKANWYTTADGRYLVFGSINPLTGYDSTKAPGVTCKRLTDVDGSDPAQCVELFRYSAQAQEHGEEPLVCVSCGSPGSHPTSQAEFERSIVEDETPSGGPVRPISENGSYVFFDTASALTPEASDDKLHVYEWHDGKVSMVSPAGDLGNSWFEGSSADGSNVFFGTHAQLAPQDTDQSGDLYDARIGGGFVGLTPTSCTGTGCQGVPAAPPIFATPASVTFEGVGNFAPSAHAKPKAKPKAKPCGRNRVRRHGRCVRAKTKKRTKPARGRK